MRDWRRASWIRMLPPPISLPLSTRSYAFARTAPGSLSSFVDVLVGGGRERMVHRKPPLLVAVPLEQRKIGHPQERELVRVEKVVLLRDRQPQLTEQLRRGVRGTAGHQEQVVRTARRSAREQGEASPRSTP